MTDNTEALPPLPWPADHREARQADTESRRRRGTVMNRYKIVKGSESAHCCFTATVVDTTKPIFFPGSGEPITRYNGDQKEQCCETVCECFTMEDAELVCRALNAAGAAIDAAPSAQPRLTVRVQSFPESNGKRNWTALLVRVDPWGGLVGNCGGITIDRGEFWNRVAYEAERAKLLIGERDTEPDVLDYGDDITTPDQWAGEVRDAADQLAAAIREMK